MRRRTLADAVSERVPGVLTRLIRLPVGRPSQADPGGALLYTDPATRRPKALCPDGTTVSLTSSGGSGAPTTADYLVKTANGSLSAERVVTDTTSITWDWATAGQAKAKRAALTGDVTASADDNATSIAARAVTFAKLVAATTTKVLVGRNSASGGDFEEVTLTQLLDWVGSAARGDILTRGAATWGRTALGTSGQSLGSDGTDVVWQTRAAGALVQVSSPSLGTDYELWQDFVVRKVYAGHDADPPAGWSLTNSAKLTSHSVASGVATMVHDGTNVDTYGGGTATAPYYLHSVTPRPTGQLEIVCRICMTATNATNDCVRFYMGKAAGYASLGFDILRTATPDYKLRANVDDAQSDLVTGANAATASTGWWCRIIVNPNGAYSLHYATGSGSVPADSGWTWGKSGISSHLQTAGTWVVAEAVSRASGTGATGTFWPAVMRVTGSLPGMSGYVPLGGGGYVASTAVTVYDDCLIGASVTDGVLNAAVQTALTGILNQLQNDSATWEVAVLRATTAAGYGAATWTGAGAVACTGSGQYVRVQLRATGTTTSGSIRRGVAIPVVG